MNGEDIMRVNVDEKTKTYIRQAQQSKSEIITEADLERLPEPLQRYLRYAQVLNKPKVKCVKVRQKGLLRLSPAQKGMPIEAVQYTTLVGSLSRIWYAKARLGPLNLLTGYDFYDNGAGHMLMRLLSMFPVVNIRGPEIDMSALIIFVNDMVMWPTAFLSDYFHWELRDANSVYAHVSLHGKQFTAILCFNDLGEMIDFITEDRYSTVGKEFKKVKWSTPFRKYRPVNGLMIPSEGEAIWHLPDGEFQYIQIAIGEIQYDTFDLD